MDDVWRVVSGWRLAGHEELELLLRMVLACFMGYVIGYERMNREKSAGMRTHAIVCLGAALIMIVSKYGFEDIPDFDASRVAAQIVSGVAEGCRQAGAALVGGETAEMPGFYAPEEYDLAGFSVGIVDKAKILDGSAMEEGDILLGLGSSGVHSNGFSLVRKVLGIDSNPKALDIHVSELGRTLGEELLRPTHIYVRSIQCLRQHGVEVKAISHITGGGLYENVPRMMKAGLTARIQKDSFPVPPIFEIIQRSGDIPERDMYNTFNMGIGLVIAIPKDQIGHALDVLARLGKFKRQLGAVCLILTALGGGLYALLRRVRRLEEQVALLRDRLWRLEDHRSQISKD